MRPEKNGTLLTVVGGKAAKFKTPGAWSVALTLGFTGGESGRQCAGVERIFRRQGKKSALRPP